MTHTSTFAPLGTKPPLWSCIVTFILLSPIVCANASAQDKLAVINEKGEVWARDVSRDSIGVGTKLTGPGLFGGPDDQFVVAFRDTIAVVTRSGVVWSRTITENDIGAGAKLPGNLFGGSDAKYVFRGPGDDRIYVVNNRGEVWTHHLAGPGTKLNGTTLFGGPNDKYVVYDGARILVINTNGEVWAHDLSRSAPTPSDQFVDHYAFDTIGDGYKLTGPTLFGAPNDRYVVSLGGRLLVINSIGEVWARDISRSSVAAGVKLNGPGLFGTPNDAKYVVGYRYEPPQTPPK